MGQPVVHFEIGCRDQAKTARFRGSVWLGDAADGSGGDDRHQGRRRGVQGHISALGHEPHNYTIFYVQVDDIPAALEKAEALGGKRLVGPVEIPTGRPVRLVRRSGREYGRALAAGAGMIRVNLGERGEQTTRRSEARGLGAERRGGRCRLP